MRSETRNRRGTMTSLLSEGRMTTPVKTCRGCLKDKPVTEFYKHPRMADGRLNHCTTCKQDYQRSRANRNRNIVAAYLEGKRCELCGVGDPIVLEFDHIDPATKIDCVGNLVAKGAPPNRLLEEIGKCRILCANCHRVHTHQQNFPEGTYRTQIGNTADRRGKWTQLQLPF
jgi:hypothetical protein